jgi:hypothetical protein
MYTKGGAKEDAQRIKEKFTQIKTTHFGKKE